MIRRSPRAFAIGAAVLLALLAATGALAAPPEPDPGLERSVKAAFVYKFLDYVEWPPAEFVDAQSPFVIGILGSDAMVAELSRLAANRTVAGRPVEIRGIKRGDPLSSLHVVFVARNEAAQLPPVARLAQAEHVLLVTEVDTAAPPGAMINLVNVDGRIRFDVALEPAEKAGIRLSSRLLAVARVVKGGGE